MSEKKRYCPLCDEWMGGAICPVHTTPTVAESTIVESETTTLDEGLTLAGRYRIGRLLGQGGMGAVYEAYEGRVGRKVALKILTRSRLQDPVHLRRFYREARAAGALEHPSIVRVYDFGVDDETGFPYLVMECIDGLPLQRLLDETGPLPEARAAHLVLQVAQALTEAHSKGIVHRDLKPENLIVRRLSDGAQQVKVLDFGVAKIRQHNDEELQTLTAEGIPIGTPLYMSPEQARGSETDFRSDLYALGFILYRLLSGQAAMADDSPLGTLIRQVVEEEPKLPSVLADGLQPSAALIALYHSLVAKDPNRRPNSTTLVVERLQSIIRLAEATTLDETNPPRPISNADMLAVTMGPSAPPLMIAPENDEDLGRMGTAPLPILESQPAIAAPKGAVPEHPVAQVTMPVVSARAPAQKILVFVLVVAGLVGWGLWSVGAGQNGSISPEVGAGNSAPPAVQKVVAVTPGPQAEPVRVGPEVRVRTIRITSGPSGALVHRQDTYLGETPLDYAVDASQGPFELRLSVEGYPVERRTVTDEAIVHVAFRRAARAPKRNESAGVPAGPARLPEGPKRRPHKKEPVSPTPAKQADERQLPTW